METAEAKDNAPRTVPPPSNSQVIKEQQQIMTMLTEQHQTKGGPKNLYAHISEVLSHLVMFYPDEALQRLEEVSYILKNQDTVALEEFLRVHDNRGHAKHNTNVAEATCKQIDTMREWFKKGEGDTANNEAAEEGDEGGDGGTAIGFIPDIISENRHLYPWAGISLGEYGCLILQKSLKDLCAKSGASNMRFWGKIRGTTADYFIAEGTADAAPAEGQDEEGGARGDLEARGEGVNVYSYWVTNSPECKNWVLLPDLKPEDLDAARAARVQFTGNLNQKIYTNPFFFKTESFLLRAQIARISFSTSLVPIGAYRISGEEPTQIEDNIPEDAEDPKAPIPTTSQAANRQSWAHYTRNILKCGRITHTEPLAPEGEQEGAEFDPEAAKLDQEKGDPFERRLKPITEDSTVVGGLPPWVVRSYGDSSSYASANPAHPNQQFNVVVVKSLLWPGAYTFFSRGAWTQVYVGDGLKHEACTYFPVNPPIMCADPEERCVEEEPNPTEAYQRKKEEAEKRAARADAGEEE